MDTTIDPTALALKRALFKAEGGSYSNVSGDNGTSAGAGQWNNGKIPLKNGEIPSNFKSDAQQFGLDPNDFSETAQDHVGYLKVKKDLDDGLTQSQIAAKWNSGLTHGWENHVGDANINGKIVHYDTPAYVTKVKNYYEQEMGGGNSQDNNQSSDMNSDSQKTFTGSIPNGPAAKPHTVAGNLIRGLINSTGIPSIVASGVNLAQTIEGKPVTDTFHNGYLGNVSRVGKDFDPSEGLTSKNLGAVADAAVKGASLASTVAGGESAAKGVAGLLDGSLLKGSSALTSPAVENALKPFDIPMSQFKTLSSGDQLEYLTQALPKAGAADKIVLQQAIDKITPQAISEAGGKISFSQLHPKLAKIPSIIKTLSGLGTTVGVLDVLNKVNKK